MKTKYIFIIILLFFLINCSGFYSKSDKSGFKKPGISDPVLVRPSGEYYPFDCSFNKENDIDIKYTVSTNAVDDYKDINTKYEGTFKINENCIVSAYSYTQNEVSNIAHYNYIILKDIPAAVSLSSPAGSGIYNILRWDELVYSPITWTDTLSGRNLSYYVEFDFNNDGLPEYSINNGNSNTLSLSLTQFTNLKYNDCYLKIIVNIKDNFGTLIKEGIVSSFKYTHKYSFSNAVKNTVMSVSETGNNFFISSAGKDDDGNNQVQAIYMLPDHSTNLNVAIPTTIINSVASITNAYIDQGIIFFCIYDTSDSKYKIYYIQKILTNTNYGTLMGPFEGSYPFVKAVNNYFYMIYMKENSGVMDVLYKKYSSGGTSAGEGTLISSLSETDRIVSFDYNNNLFTASIEYYPGGVKSYKTYFFNNDLTYNNLVTYNSSFEMSDFSSKLTTQRSGVLWIEQGKYLFRSYKISDGTKESITEIYSPSVTRPYINGIDNIFHIVYEANYVGSNELFYVNITDGITKGNAKRITSDNAVRSFIRIAGNGDQYIFWLEDYDINANRIF